MADPKGTPETPASPAKDTADKVIEFGELMVKIGKILKPLPQPDRIRVIKTVAAWYDIPLEGV